MHSSPIEVASAAFADDANIYEVHANLVAPDGPYCGIPFHVVIVFPRDYPTSPPSVRLSTMIPHPNVFSTTCVCVDLLQANSSREPYVGWSSAYTLQSILLQLESFLFDDRVPQGGSYVYTNAQDAADPRVRASVDAMRAHCCDTCGHRGAARPFPPLPGSAAASAAASAGASAGATLADASLAEAAPAPARASSRVAVCLLAVLPEDVLKSVFDMLAYEDLKAAFNASAWLRARLRARPSGAS
jgi:ubiquitin-protein ligase